MIHEFVKAYETNPDISAELSTGSGVHLQREVDINFTIMDRQARMLTNLRELDDSHYFSYNNISILDENYSVLYSNYKTGQVSSSFSLSEAENINLFGEYSGNFGIRVDTFDKTQGSQTSIQADFMMYGNVLQYDFIFVTDGAEYVLYNSG
jgi:hypothetical protein